jgi:hypothetical protein
MMSKQRQDSDEVDGPNVPKWLGGALRLARDSELLDPVGAEPDRESPAFRRRCHEAAEIAFSVAKLRSERQRVGFVLLSFTDYVRGLAKVAGIHVDPVLAWFGIGDTPRQGPTAAKALARFARAIGIGLRETLAHTRIEFASQVGAAPIPLLVARRRSTEPRRHPLEECESILKQVEADYDVDSMRDLRRIESELREEYEARGDSGVDYADQGAL